MFRTLFLAFTFCTLTLALVAEDPKQLELKKKPMYERMLPEENARAVADLTKQIKEFEIADNYPEAIRAAKDRQALRSRIQGADHHDTIDAKIEVTRLQILSDQPETKRRDFRLAYQGYRKAQSLMAEGQYAPAQPDIKRYLEISREIFGEDHPDTALGYNSLAYNLDLQGKTTEAMPLYLKALSIRRDALGEDHPDTSESYNNVAVNHYLQGKLAEALPLYQRVLEINRKVQGEEHTSTAISYNNLAMNLDALGKAAEAQPLHQQALSIRRKILGEDHTDTAQSYNNLALNLGAQGRAAEAQPHFLKALEINLRVMGEVHTHTATSYANIGFNLDAQGKAAEAQPFHQKALDIYLVILGEDHPQTATTYDNLALNLEAQGHAVEAQSLYQKVLKIRQKILGGDHYDTAGSHNNVAYNLDLQGKHTQAESHHRKALEIYRNVLGDDHPSTANSFNNLATNRDALGLTAEAEPLYQKALSIRRKVLGEDHPSTATSYNNLALNFRVQGKTAEAEATLRKAIFSAEASRLNRARGIERAIGEQFNPRLLLATIEQKKSPMPAWNNVELTLSRGMLDQLGPNNLDLSPVESAELIRLQNRATDLQSRILALVSKQKRTDMEVQQLEQLLTDRREAGQKLANLAVTASTRIVANSKEIQAAIPADVALLLWVDLSGGGIEEHFACVVRRDGEPKWERLPGTGADGKWTMEDSLIAGQLRNELAMKNPSKRTIESLAKKLHAQRIAPVLKHLDDVKTLYVVGVNEMAGIPVSLLTDQFTICYVPSGTFLARLMDRPKPKGSQFLAVGDAIYETEKKKVKTSTDLPPGGILITQVIPMSTAAKSGLQVGDVILKYGDAGIAKLEDLQKASASTKAEKVLLAIWREGEAKPFPVEIAAGRMGVVLDRKPAPVAIANRRKTEAMLASIRGGDWSDLPGTRVETNRLKQLFGDHAKVFTDGNASEQTLEGLRKSGELSKYRYLHFATHGEGNNVKAFESALILSQDNLPKELMPKAGEPFMNGQLSAREVLDYWKLNAELVTLSACETAIGKSGGGDGLLGFAQAFLTAGARCVCLSLWKVDDTATALLMSRFYENLLGKREGLSKPMGKAVALAEAKRWLRGLSQDEALKLSAAISGGIDRGTRGKGVRVKPIPKVENDEKPFAHPKYWAAFILIGDPD